MEMAYIPGDSAIRPTCTRANNTDIVNASEIPNWGDHVLASLNNFRTTGHLCDLQMVASDGETCLVHSVVVAGVSSILDSFLSGSGASKVENVGLQVLHTDISSSVLPAVVQFMYTGQLRVDEELHSLTLCALSGLGVVVKDISDSYRAGAHQSWVLAEEGTTSKKDANPVIISDSMSMKMPVIVDVKTEVESDPVAVIEPARTNTSRKNPPRKLRSKKTSMNPPNVSALVGDFDIQLPCNATSTISDSGQVTDITNHEKRNNSDRSDDDRDEADDSSAYLHFLDEQPLDLVSENVCYTDANILRGVEASELARLNEQDRLILEEHRKKYPFLNKNPETSKSSRDSSRARRAARRKATKEEHPLSDFSCRICSRQFLSAPPRNGHERRKHGFTRQYECEFCGEGFPKKLELTTHRKTAHRDLAKPSTECSKCGKCLKSINSLRTHMLTHEEPKYECSWCFKLFRFKGGLETHIEGHTGIKRYQRDYVCPNCGKTFHNSNTFSMHKKTHGPRKYPCPSCGKRFKDQSTRKQHTKRCMGNRNIVCQVCGNCYISLYELRMHMRIHTGEKPVECPYCDLRFARRNTMIKHVRRKHGRNLQTPRNNDSHD